MAPEALPPPVEPSPTPASTPSPTPLKSTEGREGDVQFLWPTPGICAPPDLDEDLLTLVEAAEDLRWLAWLDKEAAQKPSATRLRDRLRQEIPGSWAQAAAVPPDQPTDWRNAIVALARSSKH